MKRTCDGESKQQLAEKSCADGLQTSRIHQSDEDGLRAPASKSAEPQACSGACWSKVLEDSENGAFVRHRHGAFSAEKVAEWARLCQRQLKWSRPCIGSTPLPREAGWLVSDGCTCKYGYATLSFPPNVMEDWFQQLTRDVCEACGISKLPNSCNINRYNSGCESVGWHADDEDLFDARSHEALIISLSLGAPRRFELRPWQEGPGGTTAQVTLSDGDLCVMGGFCQRFYQHCVPKQVEVHGRRINLTWRWIVNHQKDCPRGMSPGALRDQLLKVAESRFALERLRARKEWKTRQMEQLTKARKQVEYYLSDENLRHDHFFHEKIAADTEGWIDLDIIMGCNKIQAMEITKDELVNALQESPLDLRLESAGFAVRRTGNRPLPNLQEEGMRKEKAQSTSTAQDLRNFSDKELIDELTRRGCVVQISRLQQEDGSRDKRQAIET
eukprot:TRINITY_DN24452_c0_g1_i1.p1 TRINITY_DN24452_c0_g1~~TRINITY_DN24452_c0_g1_i1.p1  ORF type:complete len:443 (+),score=72.67 TRINITY_DN24452_c0_g1_i1:121-1449(+)